MSNVKSCPGARFDDFGHNWSAAGRLGQAAAVRCARMDPAAGPALWLAIRHSGQRWGFQCTRMPSLQLTRASLRPRPRKVASTSTGQLADVDRGRPVGVSLKGTRSPSTEYCKCIVFISPSSMIFSRWCLLTRDVMDNIVGLARGRPHTVAHSELRSKHVHFHSHKFAVLGTVSRNKNEGTSGGHRKLMGPFEPLFQELLLRPTRHNDDPTRHI